MDPGQLSRGRGSTHQTDQTPRRTVLPAGLPILDDEIDGIKHEYKKNERLHKEEVERLNAQLTEEMEGIERKYGRLMAEKQAEYQHQIRDLEMNKNKVMQNQQLCELWRLQPDPRVLRQLLRTGSQRQTSCLLPCQTVPSPPPPCLSSASSYIRQLCGIANQREATTSAFCHPTQENIDPQPVGQHIDMMPNYLLTNEAFLTSNFDESWWWRRPQ